MPKPRTNPLSELFPEELRISQVVAVAIVFAWAMAFRIYWFDGWTMPILDGGMFHDVIMAIVDNDMRLPPTVVYNYNELPFAYPPLSFWIGAALHKLTGWDVVQILRYYPFAVHLIYIGLMIPFLRGFGFPMTGALLGFTVMIMIYQSFEWLIMGGGLTRATGAAFAIAAGTATAWAMRRDSLGLLVLAGVLGGLGLLTHMLWGVLGIILSVAAILSLGTSWKQRGRALLTGVVIVLVMVLPWLAWVLSEHGLEPFRNSQSGSMRGTHQFYWTARADIFPTFLTWFCIIGVWECLRRRVFVWPLITLSLIVIIPRNFFNVSVISNSVLATVGYAAVWIWICQMIGSIRINGLQPRWVPVVGDWTRYWVPTLLVAAWGFFGSYSDISPKIMSTLSDDAIAAMEWLDEHTPDGTAVLVINPEGWFGDEVSEWMPALTALKSLGTVQSTEWLPDDEFNRLIGRIGHLKRSLGCPHFVDMIERDWPETEYVFEVTKVRCHLEDPRLIPIYENDEVRIFKVDMNYQAD